MKKSRKKKRLTELVREYKNSINISRKIVFISIAAVFAAVIIILISVFAKKEADTAIETETETEAETSAYVPMSDEEFNALVKKLEVERESHKYTDFGTVKVDGYINLRSEPESLNMKNIIGKLFDKAVFSIMEESGDWYLISSGETTGYIDKSYCLTGEKAKQYVEDELSDRAIIDAEVLNIRSTLDQSTDNVIGKARSGERYEILEETEKWAKIKADFSDEYEEAYIYKGEENEHFHIEKCFDEARRVDIREMALTQYDNLVLAYTDGYINIRKDPEDKGINNICGKFMKGNGGELLETVENAGKKWYKIKSGNVTGYVAAQYCVTGSKAKGLALDYSNLTAYVKTEKLNVRKEPNTDSKVWTQIAKGQAYTVVNQLDGWVEIDLDLDTTGNGEEVDHAYVSTRDNNVEVRFGLPEAVEYYPAVEAANAAAAFRNKIVNYACQFIGNRYVWGGTSLTKGCDCSGFVQSVFKHFGISVPRTSVNQAKTGQKIKSGSMKPGDLVFYANSSGTINHVGIYIGNGQIVNAASRKSGIKIYRWNYRTPVAIRNIIGK